jgi:hypothetical protein
MRKLTFTFAVAFCLTKALAGEDHLEPSTPWWYSDEQTKVMQVIFKEAWGNDVRTRTFVELGGLALPKTEITLLTNASGHYRIIDLSVPIMLMNYRAAHRDFELKLAERYHTKSILPPDFHTLKVTRCEVEISPTLGKRILAVWRDMMLRTRYFKNAVHPAMDAGWIDYWMSDTEQSFAGTIPTSYSEPMTAKFSDLSYDMQTYCAAKSKASLGQLDKDVSDLARLEQQNK